MSRIVRNDKILFKGNFVASDYFKDLGNAYSLKYLNIQPSDKNQDMSDLGLIFESLADVLYLSLTF